MRQFAERRRIAAPKINPTRAGRDNQGRSISELVTQPEAPAWDPGAASG